MQALDVSRRDVSHLALPSSGRTKRSIMRSIVVGGARLVAPRACSSRNRWHSWAMVGARRALKRSRLGSPPAAPLSQPGRSPAPAGPSAGRAGDGRSSLYAVTIAAAIMVAVWTWVRGIRLIFHKTQTGLPLVDLIHQLERSPPTRVPNTAIFLSSDPDVVPTAMLVHNLKHNMVLHEQNIVMNVRTATIPRG